MRPHGRPDDPRDGADAGFSLVEAVMSMGICAVLVTSLAGGLIGGLKTDREARDGAQAADLLRVETERARARAFPELRLRGAELAGDPLVQGGSAPRARVGDAAVEEPVVLVPTSAAVSAGYTPHTTTSTRQSTTYTLRHYVTQPASCACRRYSVLASWTKEGRERRRWSSVLIADTDRGVASNWSLGVEGGAVPAPASRTVRIPLQLWNHGNRDRWTLTAAVAGTGGPAVATVRWYEDDDANGSLMSRDLPGVANTGRTASYESGAVSRLVLELTLAQAGTHQVTIRSASVVDPTVTREFGVEVTVP
ncbi:type IV pilus modification PilV family protein [Kineococcus sp. NUM-3379]